MKGKLAKLLKSIKKEYVVSSAVIILLGIVLAFFPTASTKLLCYTIAASFILIGVVVVVKYFRSEEKGFIEKVSLVAGILIGLAGFYILIKPLALASILWLVFGIIMVIDGVYKVMHAITLGKNGANRWWSVLIIAMITTLLGLIVIFKSEAVAIGFIRFIGIAFIVDGIADIFSTIYLSRVIKKLEPEYVDAKISEAEYELIEENDD